MSKEVATIRVTRYRPEKSQEPCFQEYQVPYTKDMVVLDALNYIKSHIDGTLTYRWSCRMGVCGSCGANIDGTPKLTCASFLHEFKGRTLKVEPLSFFPVIKDLVVNMDDFMKKLVEIKPWIIRENGTPPEQSEYKQTPEELERYQQFSSCINCMLCYAACPIYGLNEKFLGPAATALAYRYIEDSRDQGAKARFPIVHDLEGVWECTLVGECSVVCPKGVDPMLAIQKTKILGSTNALKSILMPRSGS
ncbi:MAG TPA: succinate dehydrogenase iron-sulfur subunit [Candidatus Bathyarchaeia archaeon]|nr:succinate dehydrogenase iron-sulfur subunit [Candidatus Bathyarchaeia archaeon]